MPESMHAPFCQTIEVYTGNVATVNDARDTTKPNNGARNPLGAAFYLSDSSGRIRKYRYVRYNPTANVTVVVGPVYWKDNTFTVVTQTRSESVVGDALNGVAGVILNATPTNGNFVFIQTYGYLAAMPVVAATALSDALVTATGIGITARVASGTAPTGRVLAWALTAVSGGVSDVLIAVEDL